MAFFFSQAFSNFSYKNTAPTEKSYPQAGGDLTTDLPSGTLITADVKSNTIIDEYISFPLIKISNRYEFSGLSFSYFYFTLPTTVDINSVKFSSSGANCQLASNRVSCYGKLTSFTIFYSFFANAKPTNNNILSVVDGLYTTGFNFNGKFNVIFRNDLMKFHRADIETSEVSNKLLSWKAINSTDAENKLYFKLTCVLINYTSANFKEHTEPTRINIKFINSLKLIDRAAKENNVRLLITSSFRNVVVDAKNSAHMIGHAIDMNVYYDKNFSLLCTWKGGCFQQPFDDLPGDVRAFIQEVISNNIRWGGNFDVLNGPEYDPVHFDKYPSLDYWHEQREIIKNNPSCSLGKFKSKE